MAHNTLIRDLNALNKIVETLNQAVDVRQALDAALERLVDLMGLKTGWIFLKDSSSQNRWAGKGFILASHYNLPPAMSPNKARPWKGTCECQGLCQRESLTGAYNEVLCSRLRNAPGERNGLKVHATIPLRSGEKVFGLLNVAGPQWEEFSEEALVLLTNVGSQMGIALDRAHLFDLLQEKRIDEQSALLAFSNQLLGHSNLDKLMGYLVGEVRSLLQVDACAVLLPGDDATQSLCFRAASGWHVNPALNRYTVPADGQSGFGQVMKVQQPLVIEDLQACNPGPWTADWWRTEAFRGHAVLPLIADGDSVGVLAINMRRPRLLSDDEVRLLRLMANQAAIAIDNARLHQEEIKQQRLEEELAVARRIQETLLPEACPSVPGWEFAACYCPAYSVGGDFYDFFELPGKPNRLGLVIADVADKGIPAALFMALSRTIIRTKAMSGVNPATVMARSNRLITKDSRAGLFVTAFYAIIEIESGKLVYTNGGHNRPLWLHASTGQIEELAIGGMVLGVFEQIKLGQGEVSISSGDTVVFYTDGVTEAMDATDELFGELRLKDTIAANAGNDAQSMMQAIIDAVNVFIGERPLADDFTICVAKRLKD